LHRTADLTLSWVEQKYPFLEPWRELAAEWISKAEDNLGGKLKALGVFLERYIVKENLPSDPRLFFVRGRELPNFYKKACTHSTKGVAFNNAIHNFLEWVLWRDEFTEAMDDGRKIPAFLNPVDPMSNKNFAALGESVYSPLPYGYIDELRQMLAEGPNFCDWKWAQSELGAEVGKSGFPASDWFEVTEDQIDHDDPDCVWRTRPTLNFGDRLEMWSPVRWVALLVKLILPLRTFQVSVLDSGEADSWRWAKSSWTKNSSRLAQGTDRRPLQQGVFRRPNPNEVHDLPSIVNLNTLLYVNTNKTADIGKLGSKKGYVFPWVSIGKIHEDVFYWLEKMRNWQEKYNPISQRTAWAELDCRHMEAKTDAQLAGYPDACFLFRYREGKRGEHHLPIARGLLDLCWFRLLEKMEQRLANRGETSGDGRRILLVPPSEEHKEGGTKTYFPLHSLRVSLITALALDGKLPIEVLYRLVGHSRLVMTLYYIRPGMTYLFTSLSEAAKRMEAEKEKSIHTFLLNAPYEQLLKEAICNDQTSLSAVIPRHPAARNSAGWKPLHIGMCLVGGNTSEIDGKAKSGGCFNGGPIIQEGTHSRRPKHGPVPGGSENCVRCRWFVTEPKYLAALHAHHDNLCYHCDEARIECWVRESALEDIKSERADAEDAGLQPTNNAAYIQAERLYETSRRKVGDLLVDIAACSRLMDRCIEAHNFGDPSKRQIVAAGTIGDLRIGWEADASKLLQINRVCQSAEIYPEEDPGKAILDRSQFIDKHLILRERKPAVLTLLSEKEQLQFGNAFVRDLAVRMNPENPDMGERDVIRFIDAGKSLSEHFGFDITSLLPKRGNVEVACVSTPAPQFLIGDES